MSQVTGFPNAGASVIGDGGAATAASGSGDSTAPTPNAQVAGFSRCSSLTNRSYPSASGSVQQVQRVFDRRHDVAKFHFAPASFKLVLVLKNARPTFRPPDLMDFEMTPIHRVTAGLSRGMGFR